MNEQERLKAKVESWQKTKDHIEGIVRDAIKKVREDQQAQRDEQTRRS